MALLWCPGSLLNSILLSMNTLHLCQAIAYDLLLMNYNIYFMVSLYCNMLWMIIRVHILSLSSF